ncbi:MAG: hypothetical protein IKH54_03505 [Bacilli bacterium]|nr:hypothetical protein [Bacilli bacterium]
MKKKLPIIIVLIALIITAIGVILLFNTNKPTDNKKEKEIKKEIEQIDTQKYNEIQEQVQNEINIFDMYLSSLYPIKDIDSIKDEDKTLLLLKVLSNEETNSIDEDIIVEEAKKHFNNYKPYNKKTEYYSYNNKKYTLIKNNYEACNIKTVITKEESNKEEWITTKKIYYIKLDLKDQEQLKYEVKVYKSYKDCNSNTNELLRKENAVAILNEDDYNSISEQLNSLKYTLKNNDGIYKVTSIK